MINRTLSDTMDRAKGENVRALICSILLVAGAARAAEDADTRLAKSMYEEGTKQYQVGDYRKALDAFKAAYLAKPDPNFLYNLGQCYRMLHELEPEIREYRAYLRERPDATNRSLVEGFIADAEAELALLRGQKDLETPASPPAAATAAAAAAAPAPPPEERKAPRRWVLPVAIGAGALVVGAVTLGLIFGLPEDAAAHGSAYDIRF
jgi:tetratricopeptide (TPR) repeat protein